MYQSTGCTFRFRGLKIPCTHNTYKVHFVKPLIWLGKIQQLSQITFSESSKSILHLSNYIFCETLDIASNQQELSQILSRESTGV